MHIFGRIGWGQTGWKVLFKHAHCYLPLIVSSKKQILIFLQKVPGELWSSKEIRIKESVSIPGSNSKQHIDYK